MKAVYAIDNICCAACATKIEHAVSKLSGVSSACVNFITMKMTVEAEDTEAVFPQLEKIVKKYEPGAQLKRG